MTIRKHGPVPIAALDTDEGIQAMMRDLFPDEPGLHHWTAEDFRTMNEVLQATNEPLSQFWARPETPKP
jgi:hypothetical protein